MDRLEATRMLSESQEPSDNENRGGRKTFLITPLGPLIREHWALSEGTKYFEYQKENSDQALTTFLHTNPVTAL